MADIYSILSHSGVSEKTMEKLRELKVAQSTFKFLAPEDISDLLPDSPFLDQVLLKRFCGKKSGDSTTDDPSTSSPHIPPTSLPSIDPNVRPIYPFPMTFKTFPMEDKVKRHLSSISCKRKHDSFMRLVTGNVLAVSRSLMGRALYAKERESVAKGLCIEYPVLRNEGERFWSDFRDALRKKDSYMTAHNEVIISGIQATPPANLKKKVSKSQVKPKCPDAVLEVSSEESSDNDIENEEPLAKRVNTILNEVHQQSKKVTSSPADTLAAKFRNGASVEDLKEQMAESHKERIDVIASLPGSTRALATLEKFPFLSRQEFLLYEMELVTSRSINFDDAWQAMKTKVGSDMPAVGNGEKDFLTIMCWQLCGKQKVVYYLVRDKKDVLANEIKGTQPYLAGFCEGSVISKGAVEVDGTVFCKLADPCQFSVAMGTLLASYYVLHLSYPPHASFVYKTLAYHLLDIGKVPNSDAYKKMFGI